MALASEIAFVILMMNNSVFPSSVKKGGNITTVAQGIKDMMTKVRIFDC